MVKEWIDKQRKRYWEKSVNMPKIEAKVNKK